MKKCTDNINRGLPKSTKETILDIYKQGLNKIKNCCKKQRTFGLCMVSSSNIDLT